MRLSVAGIWVDGNSGGGYVGKSFDAKFAKGKKVSQRGGLMDCFFSRKWQCCGIGRHTPRAKALFYGGSMRPKAEALGYLDVVSQDVVYRDVASREVVSQEGRCPCLGTGKEICAF